MSWSKPCREGCNAVWGWPRRSYTDRSCCCLMSPALASIPGPCLDFMAYLEYLRDQEGVSVLLTTHILEEAEHCDRVGILHQGRLVAVGTPDELKARVGGDVVVVQTSDPAALQRQIHERFGCAPVVVDGSVRVEMA